MADLDGVDGHQRIAAFLLSLDEEVAAAVLRGLDDEVAAQVALAMVDLDDALTEEGAVDTLYREIAQQLNGPRTVQSCGEEQLRKRLADTFGAKRADEVFQGIQRRRLQDRPFLAVETFGAGEIAQLLRNESPAVTALTLAHLPPSKTAKVLKQLDEELALDVLRRMATLQPPPPAVLGSIAQDLAARLSEVPPASPKADPSERLKSIAEVLNRSTPEIEKRAIETIGEESVEMADELREYMFTWEDIGTIDKRTMQKILGTVDTKTLSVALKACSEAVEANVMGNLSTRVRAMVAEERELAGAMPMSEVKGARDEVLKNIRAMIEAGEFRPSRGGDDLVS